MALIDNARTAVRGALCSVLGGLENIDRFAVNLGLPEPAPPNFPGTPFGNIVNNAQGIFCDRFPVAFPAPVIGGQCTGPYTVNYTIGLYTGITGPNNPGNLANQSSESIQVQGPITPPRLDYFSANQFTGTCRGFNYRYRGFGNGTPFDLNLEGSTSRDGNPNCFPEYRVLSLSVSRNGGLPDNCGNFQPTPLPQPDRTRPITINNINGNVVFAFPILNINGNLQVGFNLNVGELQLSGTVELNTGDINFNFGGQPVDPDAPEVPTPDATPPDAEKDDPENEKKANIIGVIVISTPIGNYAGTEIPKNNMPDLFIPRIADVSFQIRIKNKSHWTSDQPVKSRNAYIPCPGEIDAIDVVVEPQSGWSVSATPVRGIVPSNQVVLV